MAGWREPGARHACTGHARACPGSFPRGRMEEGMDGPGPAIFPLTQASKERAAKDDQGTRLPADRAWRFRPATPHTMRGKARDGRKCHPMPSPMAFFLTISDKMSYTLPRFPNWNALACVLLSNGCATIHKSVAPMPTGLGKAWRKARPVAPMEKTNKTIQDNGKDYWN